MPFLYDAYARSRYPSAANDYSQVMTNLTTHADTIIGELTKEIERILQRLHSVDKKIQKKQDLIEKNKSRPLSVMTLAVIHCNSFSQNGDGADRVVVLMNVIHHLIALTQDAIKADKYRQDLLNNIDNNYSKMQNAVSVALQYSVVQSPSSAGLETAQQKVESLQRLFATAKKHTIKPLLRWLPSWLLPPSHTYRKLSKLECRYGLQNALEVPPCAKTRVVMRADSPAKPKPLTSSTIPLARPGTMH